MRSFAVWWNGKKNNICPINRTCPFEEANLKTNSFNREKELEEGSQKADIHVNIWKDHLDSNIYIDFGIVVYNMDNMDSIHIYCPFKLEKDNVYDLVKRFNSKLINAIFNEDYRLLDGFPKRKIVKVKNKKQKKQARNDFILYELDEKNEISLKYVNQDIEHFNEYSKIGVGTIINLSVKDIIKLNQDDEQLKDIKPHYFRIRIKKDLGGIQLISQKVNGTSWLENYLMKTEIIDFRLNDIRSMCSEVMNEINKGNMFKIMAVHYLILRIASDTIIYQGSELTMRMLETDLWHTYLEEDEEKRKNDMIAYHFKKKAVKNDDEINDFTILTLFQIKTITAGILSLYLICTILIGIVGNAIFNFICSLLFSE